MFYIVFINYFTGYNWHSNNAPHKAFNFQLDSHDMILTIDKGTYAVRSGNFIVISLVAEVIAHWLVGPEKAAGHAN